jgi:hypothetical protein
MSSVTRFGVRLRTPGSKVAGGVRNIGQKISSVALRLTPGLTAINPALGAAAAAVGGIAGVISRIAGIAEHTLEGKLGLRDAVGSVQQYVAAVKSAYNQERSSVSLALEQRR